MWQKLKLDTNVLVSDNLKPDLFNLIQEFSDVFTDEHVKVGNTSWVQFRIDLKENAQPVKQKVLPLPPTLKKN